MSIWRYLVTAAGWERHWPMKDVPGLMFRWIILAFLLVAALVPVVPR